MHQPYALADRGGSTGRQCGTPAILFCSFFLLVFTGGGFHPLMLDALSPHGRWSGYSKRSLWRATARPHRCLQIRLPESSMIGLADQDSTIRDDTTAAREVIVPKRRPAMSPLERTDNVFLMPFRRLPRIA